MGKKTVIRILVLLVGISVMFGMLLRKKNTIDPSFATETTLKFHYMGENINFLLTNENDVKIIKRNLKGRAYRDNPSCGFTRDISISFSDGDQNLTLCPACDHCSIARVGDSNWYINIKNREEIENVLEKYGFSFPCE